MIGLTDVERIVAAGWKTQQAANVNSVVAQLRCADYKFDLHVDELGGVYLQASYIEADALDGQPERQQTRRWPLAPSITESELVQTAFKCVITSFEHRAREQFRYQGERVFSPHYDVRDLVALCRRGRADAGARVHVGFDLGAPLTKGVATAVHDPSVPE